MKKISLLIALLPLLGCSHLDSANEPELNQQIANREQKIHPKKTLRTEVPINTAVKKTVHINQGQEKQEKNDKRKESILLNVPLIKQNPELKYGCEVTSLAMVLQYAGVNTTKMELYKNVKKDTDPILRSKGDIIRWGNPADGFVGDMTGNTAGYAVFDQPIVELVNKYLPNRAVNLTNKSFDDVLNHVSKGFPVLVWTTGDYRLPDRWESWTHGNSNQVIRTPLDLHAVVLVGYDSTYVYLNDPLSGRKQVKVSKERFISSWKALKSRAVSYS